jgi:hypothetical protein
VTLAIGSARSDALIGILFAVIAIAWCETACTSSASTPTPTTPTPASPTSTETFTGTLPVGGTAFYSFSVAVTGTVNVTLVDIEGAGVPQMVQMNLGIGSPSGTTCSAASPTTVQIGGTAAVTMTEQPGTYCAVISDVGNLFAPATFTIEIDHP